jgi:hypothetical protein
VNVLDTNFFCCFEVLRVGWNFKSWLWQVVVKSFKLRKTWTTPLHPPSGSMVEQCVKTVEEHLRKVILTHQKDWDERMHNFLLTYKTQNHKTTGMTPTSMMFRRELYLPCNLLLWLP